MNRIVITLIIASFFVSPVWAVESGGAFDTTEPTDTQVPNWTTGWGTTGGLTGWDYVGYIGGASGVYLGNGWVLTAGHVGSGDFYLPGNSSTPYTPSGVVHYISDGTVDLTLFQLTTNPPNLTTPLTLATSDPVPLSATQPGDKVVMIGNGGSGDIPSWGYNTVTANNIQTTVMGLPYVSNDFETTYGTTTAGANSATNIAQLYSGDSGGPDFIYTSGQWTLAGINEAINPNSEDPSNNDSYMVQIDTYASEINGYTGVPEPRTEGLLLGGLTLLFLGKRRFQSR